MAIVRWEPMRELTSLQSDVNRLFNSFFEGTNGGARRWTPAFDVIEADKHLIIKGDLPGLSEDDVKIEVGDNVLTISGERRAEKEHNKDGFHRLERAFGSFSRSMTLSEGVDSDKIEATFEKGVLEVKIPKPEEVKPRRVSIGRGSKKTIEGNPRRRRANAIP
jgi:HSP20 family protein